MLELCHVHLQQGEFTLSANFAVQAGGITALLGPSGAGKSTLLSAIAGFLPLGAGRLLWQGGELTDLPPSARPISTLFQDNNLFPHLSSRDNVALGLHPARKLDDAQWGAVDQALADVGLDNAAMRRKPAQLSGGQNARVALARALIRDRPILLLDEPFGAVGPGLKAELLALVSKLAANAGTCVIMVSHDPNDAQKIAQNVIWMDQGIAHAPRATDAIFQDPPAGLAAYLGK